MTGSTRRRTLRLAVAGALAATTIAAAGCVELNEVEGVSGTCTEPTTLNDGFFANRAVFFRVSTQPSPTDPQTTWICYRVKVAGVAERAERIDVNTTTATPAAQVSTDLSSRACATGPNNVIPGPHPIEQGEVLDTPFYIDAYAMLLADTSQIGGLLGSAAWVCVEAGPVKHRVAIDLGQANEADVAINTDTKPPAIQDTTPPPVGKPSTSCSAGVYGAANEHVNAHLGNADLFLYTAQPRDNEVHLCTRLSSPQLSGGGHLAVKAATSQVIDIQQSSDTTPCTQDIVTLSNPPLSIRRSPVGQNPPSVCINNTRYAFVTGPLPPVVSFTPDS